MADLTEYIKQLESAYGSYGFHTTQMKTEWRH